MNASLSAGSAHSAERLTALRSLLAEDGVQGFLVPHADEYLSEYLPASAERLAWLTGFTGSAGTAVILRDRAALFVDGRYTLQAASEVDEALYEIINVADRTPTAWLDDLLSPDERFGFDPWLTTMAEAERLAKACTASGAELVPVQENLIDRLWQDRPAPPLGAVSLHPQEFAGRSADDKLVEVREQLERNRAAAVVLTQADSIAWTFNIRGADIPHNPAALAYAIITADRAEIVIDRRKVPDEVREALGDVVALTDHDRLAERLAELGSSGAAVLLDASVTSQAVADTLTTAGATIIRGKDPASLPKACKNATELRGARAAHIRDGAAMTRFLAWLERHAPAGDLDEIAAADRLAEFRADTARRDDSELVDLSFDTISGAGPNGAIVHYRVTPATARKLEANSLYLTDSGGQYRDGTTDITRTVAIGTPTDEMRDRFTRVLKGHIAIATAVFPEGTSGAQIDVLARAALWQLGLDYDHGTGHGVGSFLSVHEGPANISRRSTAAMKAGMILTNEPGYYKTGQYGIRIENLLIVRPAEQVPGGDRAMHRFETITLAPIDRNLIDKSIMTAAEVAWLNAYHARLGPALNHLLDEDERNWLAEAARPL